MFCSLDRPCISSADELITTFVFACWFLKDWYIATQNAGMLDIPLNLLLKDNLKDLVFSC